MAVVVDPDLLDRAQVIFGTWNEKISLYPVGNLVNVNLEDVVDGYTDTGTKVFHSASSTFTTWTVSPGDILCMYTKDDAGHFVIASVDSETQLTLTAASNFTGDTGIIFDIRDPSGGSIADGLTKQCLYSYGKEQWKTDGRAVTLGDDLIKHPFPWEAITREQMEVGGGTAHDNWTYLNEYTIKKIRTGGFAVKDSSSVEQYDYSGIVTLGTLDADAQAYYQIGSSAAVPTDFAFTGAVNEPILTYTNGGSDNRSYLKLFCRKKYRTYAGSDIASIGVTTLETIVNRFPLTHAVDPAITSTDGAIVGTTTFRTQSAALVSRTDGYHAINTVVFTSAGATFTTSGVAVGDCLHITSGTDIGDFTIQAVDSETQLTIATDADFTTFTATEGTLTFTVTSTVRVSAKTDGYIIDVNTTTGTLSSVTGDFVTKSVTAGDMLILTEAASNYRGVYKVISRDSATQITVNTSDVQFPAGGESNIDYYIVRAGMYLQYKNDLVISGPSTGNLTFADDDPDTITRASGDWASDGAVAGDIVVITGSTSNNGTFTIAEVTSATKLTLVATDTLTAEVVTGGLGSGCKIYRTFKRSVQGVTYAFRWRMFGIDASLINCYQFIQHQLRQSTDIDWGPATARGDVTALLASFAAPTGTTYDLYIDNLNATDINNVTWTDASGASRTEAYVAAGSILFNTNLQNDGYAVYKMFFLNDNAGDNTGRDYGTSTAIVVKDSTLTDIAGTVSGQSSISFTYDYDGNDQRGIASKGTDAPIVVVAIGLSTAQFVRFDGTIGRSKANNFSLVSALERNYSN